MELYGFWQIFFGGMLGPVLMELVKLAGDADKYFIRARKGSYWASIGALFILGGAVAALNGIEHMPVSHAIELGIGAPAIISGYASASAGRGPSGANAIPNVKLHMPAQKSFLSKIRDLLAW